VVDLARSSKPIHLVKGHRTKKEIEHRKKAEEALTSGFIFHEWDNVKNNKIAHKEFIRLKKIFQKIKQNDALYESIINRLCLLHAECFECEIMAEKILKNIEQLEEARSTEEMTFMDYFNAKNKMYENYMKCDKKIMEKRKAILDIEKENIMTVASVLRSVPKKPHEEKEVNPYDNIVKYQGR
jgi:hypothetical protein